MLGGVAQVVNELSPYVTDFDWDGLADTEQINDVSHQFGHAVAKIHCTADAQADLTLVPFPAERAIAACIGNEPVDEFAARLVDFAFGYADVVREDHQLFIDAFRNHEIDGL
jgi:hypothetical protein